MWLKPFVLYNLILINFIVTGDIGDKCRPNGDVSDGTCVLITDCEVAISSIRNRNYHQFQRCGFHGIIEIVCCPTATNKTVDKFGANTTQTDNKGIRIADRECQKIVSTSIPPLDLHIIGGETASLGEFPHMVALGFDRSEGYQFDCGGSLLSNTYVLTAAHCVDTLDGIEPSIVRVGVIELGDSTWNDETDFRIAQILRHPNYTRREKYHDLALLRLEKAIPFSNNVNAACLYTSNNDPTTALTITGWGTTSTTRDTRSNQLLKANVSIVPRDRCSESYSNWRKLPRGISSEQLCAGDPDGARDTCQGDSGGPLQGLTSRDGQYRLVGVTSFGRGCGSPVPGVYTRIAHYIDWIEGVVWQQ